MPTTDATAIGIQVAVMAAVTLASGEPAEWVQVLPLGTFGGRDGRGPYTVDGAAHAQQILAATAAHAGSTDPVIDYDHQTDYAAKPGVGGRAPAAAWFKEFEVRADGIYGRPAWTAAAHAALKAQEYRYFSPVFSHTKDGRVVAILRGGLTNSPNLDLVAVASQQTPDNPEPQNMTIKAIALALGLGETATEADCLGAIGGLKGSQEGLATVAQAAGLAATAASAEIVTAVQSAIAGQVDMTKFVAADVVVSLQSQLTALQADTKKKNAESAVDAAILVGKVAPQLRGHFIGVHMKNPADFAAFEAAAPVIVPPGQRQLDGDVETQTVTMSAEDKAVAADLGLTEAQFLEAKKGSV